MKKLVKETLGTGIATMGGSYALGSMANLPGMPAQAKTTQTIANTGLNLANVGQLAKTSMSITGMFDTEKKTKRRKKK